MSSSRENALWSLNLGRWGGVKVRLHIFFLLFAALTMLLSWQANPAGQLHWIAFLSLGILLVSVIWHDFGHCYMARRLGGAFEECVISPIGGLVPAEEPREAWATTIIHMSGPAANLVVCILTLPAIAAVEGQSSNPQSVWGLLHPFAPIGLTTGDYSAVALKLTFWINWLLVLVNFIPAFPFDAGRAMKAMIAAAPTIQSRRRAGVMLARLAQGAAGGLLVGAWFSYSSMNTGPVPLWFSLVLLAIFLLFAAKHELRESSLGMIDEKTADASDSDPWRDDEDQAFIVEWLREKRAEESFDHEEETEEQVDEETRVDEILAQVHQRGMGSLSPEDRAVLERASARYRDRSAETE